MSKLKLRDAALFDMDGTLCDVRGIRHHLIGKTRNFHRFHRESVNCPPNQDVVDAAVEDHAAGLAILIVTARVQKYWPETQFFLRMHLPVPWDELYMRNNNDFRKDNIVKEEILAQIRADGYNPVKAHDDNPAVIEVWERNGIPTTIVEGFGFE